MVIFTRFVQRLVFALLLPISSLAATQDPILEQIKPNTITIIGESHKRPESSEFFQTLVSDTIKNHQCVVVGLEIGSDQQATVDKIMQGRALTNEIKLWPQIEHPPYQRMIENFASLKAQGQCINIIAIDASMDNDVDRDEWMARQLEQAGDKPILVLLGGLHTLKKINWLTKTGKPSVTEILTTKGFSVKSFPQRWLPDQCADNQNRRSRFVNSNSPEALTILNESMMSLINAEPHKSAIGVVNGFVVWECV
ncbi:hypothetical protein [Crenothrix polyspora]|uniref:Haem-binding uptake Tiki superfamily ChaN domain-containing protein n=1 Tax=Crenothrix polyspora TaxID=360316 RepID=A0A1R4HDG4_9GAMM|nr:hypothetical protein [Crenothrix polyspora]SJM94272.1 conserved exported hypothetical protein [Crenothrix polyspora]